MISPEENINAIENSVANTSSSSSSSFGSGYIVNPFYKPPSLSSGDKQSEENTLEENVLSTPLDKAEPSSWEDEDILVCSTTDEEEDVWKPIPWLSRYRLPTDEEFVISIGEGILMCADCGFTNVSPQTMKQHINRRHNINIVHREIPTIIKKQENYVKDDVESLIYPLADNLLMCGECGNTSTSRQHLDSHVLLHLDTRREMCEVCGKLYKNINCLNVHYHRKHGLNKDIKHMFEKHKKQGLMKDKWCTTLKVNKESENKKVECKFCQKSYKDNRSLRSHYVHRHKDQKCKWNEISCTFCGITCNSKWDLYRHKREKHNITDKEFKPKQLKIKFSEEIESRISQLLDYHENKELEELSGYTCKELGCDFSHKYHSMARRHAVNHLNLPRTQCKKCDKSFKNIYYLKAHMGMRHKD